MDWAFEAQTQTVHQNPAWVCPAGGYFAGFYNSLPSLSNDGTIYFGDQKNLYAVDALGVFKWKTDFATNRISTSCIDSGNNIYFFTDHFLSFDSSGQEIWQSIEMSGSILSIAQDGILYVGGFANGSGRLFSIDPTNGNVLFTFSPTAAGEKWGSISPVLLTPDKFFIADNYNNTFIPRTFDYVGNPIGQWSATLGRIIDLVLTENGTILGAGTKLYAFPP